MKEHQKNLLISLVGGLIFLGVCFASPNEDQALTFLLWIALAIVSISSFAAFGLIGLVQRNDHIAAEQRKGESLVTSHFCGGHH